MVKEPYSRYSVWYRTQFQVQWIVQNPIQCKVHGTEPYSRYSAWRRTLSKVKCMLQNPIKCTVHGTEPYYRYNAWYITLSKVKYMLQNPIQGTVQHRTRFQVNYKTEPYSRYTEFIKYWFFMKMLEFFLTLPVLLQRWCSTCHLVIQAWSPVYTPRRNPERPESGIYFKISKKNTILNEHPVHYNREP